MVLFFWFWYPLLPSKRHLQPCSQQAVNVPQAVFLKAWPEMQGYSQKPRSISAFEVSKFLRKFLGIPKLDNHCLKNGHENGKVNSKIDIPKCLTSKK